MTVGPNHLGAALQRHRHAGELENRDQRWYLLSCIAVHNTGDRETLWGGRRGNGNFVARCNRWSAAMPQPNDLSRSLVALDQNSTIIAVIEMSQSSWLVAGMLPGIERQPRKKLEPSPERLLAVLYRWQDEAVRPGAPSRGLRLPSKPAATASGWRAG